MSCVTVRPARVASNGTVAITSPFIDTFRCDIGNTSDGEYA
ncbi:hypothetical protein BamIOP4010DRAFT_6703 [Burkholderia ambifaria IOP40-10]|uniref:Uncharacterized protein n=1 Tax=Burkholderia ambifaria IOP40-10 TaxID=396596 RepID=B1FRP0_9BURK|nr:hypothetical protein BamIOP4010DRAFT_6703 [Burkholderia ambifaria IOP40-10]